MFKIHENVFHVITFTIVFQLDRVVSNFETQTKHLEEISQIFSNNDLRDHILLYPGENIDGNWDPISVCWYSVVESNLTDNVRDRFDHDHRLERGLLRMPSYLKGMTSLVNYTGGSGRTKIIKKKKKIKQHKLDKWLKIKGAALHMAHLIKWVKIMFSKYMVSLLVAFKLKFLSVFPVAAVGLFLMVSSAGLAGFFFALFIASIGLKGWVNP